MTAFSSKDHAVRSTHSINSSRRPPLTKSYSSHASISTVGSTSSGLGIKSGGASSIQNAKKTSSPNSTLTESRKGSLRARSLSQVLAGNSNLYLVQEKAYLKRIRNQRTDDYYTKGISGASLDNKDLGFDDDSDDDLLSYGNSDLLTDFEDEKNEVDYSLAFDLMKNSGVKLSIDKNNQTIDKHTIENPLVLERLEWQAMLLSVLTGDVVRSEKTKIIDLPNSVQGQESFAHTNYKENLWFGIRAKLFNRSEDDQKKLTLYRRNLVDNLIEQVMSYSISYESGAASPREQITKVLDDYEKACDLWSTLEEMRHDKPACRSEAFQDRIDALTAWLSITDAIERETKSFASWIGNDDLDITRGATVTTPVTEDVQLTDNKSEVKKIFEEDNKSLAERIVKEKDVHMILRKRIFYPLAPWMVKSKNTYIRLCRIFEQLKLPDYVHHLIDLCLVPMRLIKEIITLRMKYAKKLQNPTLMMIDQMLEDFKSYITIALELNSGIMEYCQSDINRTWYIKDLFEKDIEEFDKVVLNCVHYYLSLLNKKLIDSSRSPYTFRTNKEPEELENAWKFLMNLGHYIDGGGILVAENITSITSRLCQKLLGYLYNQMNHPPKPLNGSGDLIRWYSSTTDNFGQLRRKLARFTGEILREFTNSVVFEVSSKSGNRTKSILEILRESNHVLVFTGTVEAQGMYFFASPELSDKEGDILKIINGRCIGTGVNRGFAEFSNLLQSIRDESYSEDIYQGPDDYSTENSYVIAFCPPKAIVWDGPMINLQIDEVPVTDLKQGQLLMISLLPYYDLHIIRDRFVDFVSDVDFGCLVDPIEQRSSLTKVHQELSKINKMFFKMTLAVLDSSSTLIDKCRKLITDGNYQELVNNYFIYARDFGKSSVKWSDASRKSAVIMRLIHMSVEWVSFICDDCTPTDRKTFRWCVLALEFAMEMTRGFNVLVLNEELFHKLKLKVARCMSLLISHFDIMGARSSEAEKRRLLKWSSQRQAIENAVDDEQVLESYQKEVMGQIEEIEHYRTDVQEQLNSIGRVLNVLDSEYHYVTLLASSFSSLSIRWQKGKFIGGGSFGQVYAAVNLDTGGVMAVKEIVFHDSQSLKLIPSIKEEMTVLEMLNHPNVVQYFGVEVHRDKVYIFMEYCEGGSLSGLLAHGRIEDEMVIQVYTLQMLEGLAYLHQSDVVHRDIKPENILLDHNGVIKFVDFGAAKVIAATGKTRNPGSSSSSSSSRRGGNPENLNSMTGTPMYMSPEVITGQSSPRNGVTDIWSLGCCVLEMATGRRPWANLDNEWAIMYHIAAGHKPQLPSADQLSEAGRKFLSRCLEHDPRKRPGAAELLNDLWIVQIRQAAFGSGEAGTTPNSETSSSI